MQRSAKAFTSLRIPYKAILTASTETRREVFYILDPCLTAEQRNGRCQQYATTRNEKQPDSQSVKQQQGHKGKNK